MVPRTLCGPPPASPVGGPLHSGPGVACVRRCSPPIPRGSETDPPGGGGRRGRRRWNQGGPILVLRRALAWLSACRSRSRRQPLSPPSPKGLSPILFLRNLPQDNIL